MSRIVALLGAALLLTGCGLVGNSSGGKVTTTAAGSVEQPWLQPVRKAICGPLDRPEPALQGQVPASVRASGGTPGYNCNLELVGQWQGDGAGWQHAWFEDCAYYGTTVRTGREHPGVVVIDATNRSNPHPSTVHEAPDPGYLQTTPMLDPWESLKVNDRRQMLAAVDGADGGGGNLIDIYDLSGDCRNQKLLASTPIEDTSGHEGNWMQDGNTYWGANGTYNAIDTSDPRNPQFILSWTPPGGTHGLACNDDGSRCYFTTVGLGGALGMPGNGFAIVDTSDVQLRKPNPEVRLISNPNWPDGSAGQHPIPVKIGGKPYVIYVDELGSAFAGANGPAGASCAQDLAPWGMPRIYDISDEANPKLVAKLFLETNDPANCPVVLPDVLGQVIFSYDSHYCSVDDPANATALACGFFNSGVRVFDIRNPYFQREIAYFNPRAQIEKTRELPGSHHDSALGASGGLLNADWCSAAARFVPERGELWTTCQDNGFMIFRFTNGTWPFASGT
jgi:hypothetical protein